VREAVAVGTAWVSVENPWLRALVAVGLDVSNVTHNVARFVTDNIVPDTSDTYTLDTSFSVPVMIWELAWIFEYDLLFRFTRPSRGRGWIAHISGISISITGLFLWLHLTKSYHFLLQRAVQATYILLILSAQIGITYLLSDPGYRVIVRKWLVPGKR